MLPGYATAEATDRFASRFSQLRDSQFYRKAQGITVSSIGLGTYLGRVDEQTDERYTEAAVAAVRGGINLLDTSLNYRDQHSERSISAGVARLTSSGVVRRDELLICTKAGYLVPDAVPAIDPHEVVGNMHCMTPAFLSDQLERSRRNLGLETIDVFYLHNPETQLQAIPPESFDKRIRIAFEALEQLVAAGRIRFYGTATWEGYRKPPGAGLSLVRMAEIARDVAGDGHHFRFVQLPYNMAMTEAVRLANETVDGKNFSVLAAARSLGITVIGSASLLQARLSRNLPDELAPRFPGTHTDAQRALQFSRSAPGLTAALVGMSRAAHVEENLALSKVAPVGERDYASFFTPGQ